MKQQVKFQMQNKFPLIKEYAQYFAITPRTIFAYDNCIYSSYALPEDLIIHEKVHLERQNKLGVDKWVKKYLQDKKFRLDEELIAYKTQLRSIGDRELRNNIRIESAKNLSSDLYGNIIQYKEAFNLLK